MQRAIFLPIEYRRTTLAFLGTTSGTTQRYVLQNCRLVNCHFVTLLTMQRCNTLWFYSFFIVYMWSSKVRGTVKYFGRKVPTSFCVNIILQSFGIKWSEYFETQNLRFLHFSSYFLKRAQRFLKTSQIHLTSLLHCC